MQSAERGRLTTKGTKNPKGEAPKGGNQEFEMDHGWGEEFRVQRGKGGHSPCLGAVTHKQDVRHFNTDPDRKMVLSSIEHPASSIQFHILWNPVGIQSYGRSATQRALRDAGLWSLTPLA